MKTTLNIGSGCYADFAIIPSLVKSPTTLWNEFGISVKIVFDGCPYGKQKTT